MEEQGTSTAPTIALPGAGFANWRWLALLLLLTTGMRVWQVWHTEVPSRDCLGFIHDAWQLEHGNCREVLRTAPHHPGYPAVLLAVSRVVRAVLGEDDLARAMQLSAQLASALASVLLVIPMFYLGKILFDARVGFWATLLFQCLPATGILMADGLSEPLFLLLVSTSLLLALRGFGSASWWQFALSGLFGGLAYLTRAEGALVPFSVGVVLLAALVVQRWRWSRVACLRCGAALSVSALLVAAPFMLVIGGPTNKPSFRHVTGTHVSAAPTSRSHGASLPGGVARSLPFGVWYYGPNIGPKDRYLWGLEALRIELGKGSFYVLWLPALLALVWFRDRFRSPGPWALLFLCLVLTALLYRVAQSSGYLSARHGAIILLLGSYWAVAGLAVIGARLAALLSRRWAVRPEMLALALLVAFAVAPLSHTLATLHADRAAFRQAGAWLAEHAEPDAEVIDPYTWSCYYAGRFFVERPAAPTIRYIVLENSANDHTHLWHTLARAKALSKVSEVEMKFPVTRQRKPGEVVVYRYPKR